MWREWCAVICFCLCVSNGAETAETLSVHHKRQTNTTITTPVSSGGNLSSGVEAWLQRYWYVPLVVLLVLVVTGIFACACAVKKVRGNHSNYHIETTSTQSSQPHTLPFSRPPLSSVIDGSLSPGMVSMDQSPVPSPQPSYSSQQSHRSSGRSSSHKKKRTLSPGQNSSGSEETIRSDKGVLRGPWQQRGGATSSMVKLSINGMQQQERNNNVSLPEAMSMLSVRSNHSGRSGRSGHSIRSHSDASSQKTVVEVDVKLHLSPDQEQDARMMTAAALAESARQLACSAARLGEEEEHYQVFSHSPPRTYIQPRISVSSSHSMRGMDHQLQCSLPSQRDTSTSRVTTPLTCTTISLDRAVNAVSLDHPAYNSASPRGKHGYLPPASPLAVHRSAGLDLKHHSVHQAHPHSPTRPLNLGAGSLDRAHPHSPTRGAGSLDRAHPHSPTRGAGSLDRAHPHSPTRGAGSLDRAHPHTPSNHGAGSLDRAHAHSPTRALKAGIGSLDRAHRSSNGLQQTCIPSVSSDRLPWQYGDAHLQDHLRQFYEQDTPPGHTGHGHRHTGHTSIGHRDYTTIDVDSLTAISHREDEVDICLHTLPHHYHANLSQEPRTPSSLGQVPGNVRLTRASHEPHPQPQMRATKQQSGSCAEDSGIQTTSFSEEPCQSPISPCCSSSAPSVEEDPQEANKDTFTYGKQRSLPCGTHQNTHPTHQTSSYRTLPIPRSNSGISMEEQLSNASGYAATGSASSIETKSNGSPSQPNQYELEPMAQRHTTHIGVNQHDLPSPAGAPTTRSRCDHQDATETRVQDGHRSISTNWIQPVIKYSNHCSQESISVDI